MPGINSSSNLVDLVRQLDQQAKEHQRAAAAVAQTLAQQQSAQVAAALAVHKTLEAVSSLLSALLGGSRSSAAAVSAPAARPAAAAKPGRRRGRAKFAMSGSQSVLAFVKSHGSPSSAEINGHWKAEGRGAKADNTLGLLVREKKLKRVANKEGRGSRYVLA